MDHSRAPVLEALQEFRRRGDVVFGPPGHKQAAVPTRACWPAATVAPDVDLGGGRGVVARALRAGPARRTPGPGGGRLVWIGLGILRRHRRWVARRAARND